MTKREMNIRVFAGASLPHVFFQPRIEPWYALHKDLGDLPERYRKVSLLELYDDLDISMRYIHYYTGMPSPIQQTYTDQVKIKDEYDADERHIVIDTPYGELVQKSRLTSDNTWRTVEFAAKNGDDLKKLAWLCHNTVISFNTKNFEQGSAFLGDRGVPQFWVPKSPYQALCQQWMKLTDFIYALNDEPAAVESAMKAIDESYDRLYEEIVTYVNPTDQGAAGPENPSSASPLQIVNLGENIDAHLVNPRYVEQYLIPFYEKRSNQLRRAGIYTHIHIDGAFRSLLGYLENLPFDGLEALTPLPQGDASIEEMKEYMGDKVLLDGIPAVLFLSYYPREDLKECVDKLVSLFHPRLVLGISDELPQGGDEESVDRVKWISDYCKTL